MTRSADPDRLKTLLDAAGALLEARRQQMVTSAEWAALARAVAACTGERADDLLTDRDLDRPRAADE